MMTERDCDQNGVDEPHHRDTADIAGERGVDAVAHLSASPRLPLRTRRSTQAHISAPSLSRKKQSSTATIKPVSHLAEQNRAGTQAARERPAVLAQRLQPLVNAVAKLSLAEIERRLGELIRRLADAVFGLRAAGHRAGCPATARRR